MTMALQKRALNDLISQSMLNINKGAKQSEILASLKLLSALVKQSTAHKKVVLIVSDMLEHSAITSFYENTQIRMINAEQELKHMPVELKADFSGARLFIVGGGLASKDIQIRDSKALIALSQFWRMYCQFANAKLVEFGMPNLLSPIQ